MKTTPMMPDEYLGGLSELTAAVRERLELNPSPGKEELIEMSSILREALIESMPVMLRTQHTKKGYRRMIDTYTTLLMERDSE